MSEKPETTLGPDGEPQGLGQFVSDGGTEPEPRAIRNQLIFGFCLMAGHRQAQLNLCATTRAEVHSIEEAEKRVRDFLEADRLFNEAHALLAKELYERYGTDKVRLKAKTTEYSYAAGSTQRVGQARYRSLDSLAGMYPGSRGYPVAIEIDGDIEEVRLLNPEERREFSQALARRRDQGEAHWQKVGPIDFGDES